MLARPVRENILCKEHGICKKHKSTNMPGIFGYKLAGNDPWVGKTPEGGHGNPLQYSYLENPHGQRSLAGYRPWGHKELDTTEQLSTAQHSIQRYSTFLKGHIFHCVHVLTRS